MRREWKFDVMDVVASYFQCGNGINCKVGVVVSIRIVENNTTYKE